MKHTNTSLYIHTPWCIHKCPYCDFNSHQLKGELPEQRYLECLIKNWHEQLIEPLHSIFIGGGTPSLMSGSFYKTLLNEINPGNIEITMEANPGTVEQERFNEYVKVGINRISLGIQSFQNNKLKELGRIHDAANALKAISTARQAGFNNINLDLMFGLPKQTIEEALFDLQIAIEQSPNHISWYQLTLEPNTLFHRYPPSIPKDDVIWEMQQQGQDLLAKAGYKQYEISAYAKDGKQCQHNLNYWRFGDYIGIGAGAHGKITEANTKTVLRHNNYKNPRDYQNAKLPYIQDKKVITPDQLLFEYMLNRLRLMEPFTINDIVEKTYLTEEKIIPPILKAEQHSLLKFENNIITKTELGNRFLNDLLEIFLTES